jgi:hypothetical protein
MDNTQSLVCWHLEHIHSQYCSRCFSLFPVQMTVYGSWGDYRWGYGSGGYQQHGLWQGVTMDSLNYC